MILVQNLNKEIKLKNNDIQILKNINFKCPEKGMVLLYGESGCGKTTLLNILEGLDEKYSGSAMIFGEDLRKIDKSKYLSKDIQIIFQQSNFINKYTVYENIKIIESVRKNKFNLKEVEKKLKEFNIINILNKDIETLSGGEKQILKLILVLMQKSKIIFCDEPTGSIDEASEEILVRLLKEISSECLVFIVSHNVELYKKYSTQCLFMKDGVIIE